jgi:hypothetical protein
MLIKDMKQNLNKYLKHIKYYQIIQSESNMIQQEFSHKDGHKWEVKLLQEIINMLNIKIFIAI